MSGLPNAYVPARNVSGSIRRRIILGYVDAQRIVDVAFRRLQLFDYDLITARVETALVKLGQEVDQDAEWQPHLSVLPFMRRTPSADKDA